MINFKEILDAAEIDQWGDYLFVLPKSAIRKPSMQRLMDEAHARGFNPVMHMDTHEVYIGECTARFCIAYPNLAKHLHDRTFAAVQAGDAFDVMDNGAEVLEALQALVHK